MSSPDQPSATLLRGIRRMLANMENVDNYMDNILVHTETWAKHETRYLYASKIVHFSEITDTRKMMNTFWKENAQKQTLIEMTLDSQGKIITELEVPEILAMLPDLKGKDVLELGAGIGRFTGPIAQQTNRIVAVDFMEKFIEKNKRNNGHNKTAEFVHGDVTTLEFQPKSFDLVFSNWLLMYLADGEVEELLRNVLSWLKNDGFVFFRESCFQPAGNLPQTLNPTQYRTPTNYTAVFETAVQEEGEHGRFGFKVIFTRPVQTYIQLKQNTSQLCWLLQKVKRSDEPSHDYTLEKSLENH